MPAPKGSSTVLDSPPSTNLAGRPSTVSEPNQVAKVAVTTMIRGSERPASA